ncbi:hypothetical protein GCM10010404_83290 [Nonomuraea africana]|uniref:Uncharacterized protein n=1 Tax=Nonomuraea africana TaxID=46171 RepID=A0ABR9KJF7_9ACTN|nr:hypothetical protein [Nonomuraea africana]MBE1562142.1 hypothetical protein [Nonomuraea africana]
MEQLRSFPEISADEAAQRRWLARTQNAHTIAGRRDPIPVGTGQLGAGERPADQDSDQSSGQDGERAWLIQMMAARTQQESR